MYAAGNRNRRYQSLKKQAVSSQSAIRDEHLAAVTQTAHDDYLCNLLFELNFLLNFR
jgi:hypothetical protein